MSELIEKQINGSRVIFFNKNQRRLFDNLFAIKEKAGVVFLMLSDKKVYIVKGITADELREELKIESDKAIELLFTMSEPTTLIGSLSKIKTQSWEINELDKTIIYNAG